MQQMQEGSRGLTMDAFNRKLQAGELGGRQMLEALGAKYGIMADQFTSPKEFIAALIEGMGEIFPDEIDIL